MISLASSSRKIHRISRSPQRVLLLAKVLFDLLRHLPGHLARDLLALLHGLRLALATRHLARHPHRVLTAFLAGDLNLKYISPTKKNFFFKKSALPKPTCMQCSLGTLLGTGVHLGFGVFLHFLRGTFLGTCRHSFLGTRRHFCLETRLGTFLGTSRQ